MSESTAADATTSAAEAALVALARLGDQSAFAELVRRRQSYVRNLMRRLCRNPALADDLSQEVFLQAWKHIRQLRSVGAFGGWLRRIAVSAWIQNARDTEKFAEPIADVADMATMVIATTAERLDLDSALSDLQPVVRLCIVLSYQEGMSHNEIASTTQLPLGTVKSHISRGTQRLRALLGAYDSAHERCTYAK